MIYLDTNILIYLLEDYPKYAQSVEDELFRLSEEQHQFVTSLLTITEFLAGTKGTSLSTLKQITQLRVAAINEFTAVKAAELQKHHRLNIGDAFHLATSLEQDCQLFFTNDTKLAKAAANYCEVLRPVAA